MAVLWIGYLVMPGKVMSVHELSNWLFVYGVSYIEAFIKLGLHKAYLAGIGFSMGWRFYYHAGTIGILTAKRVEKR